MRRVAIVGVGNMGGAIAQRLLDQRWPVQVFDVDAAKVVTLQALGATGRADAAAAVIGCGVLIVCVVNGGFGRRRSAPMTQILIVEDDDAIRNNIIRLLSRIEHPNVIRIYDQGFTDDHAYIAMEYFEQGDLRAEIGAGMGTGRCSRSWNG